MNTQRLTLALTAINLVLLVFALVQVRSAVVGPAGPLLRTHGLELVDDQGQVRSSLSAYPDGEVVLKLFDQNGTIRVKLGAAEDGSGLMLADDTAQPGVHLVARRTATAARPLTTGITLTGADGRQRAVKP